MSGAVIWLAIVLTGEPAAIAVQPRAAGQPEAQQLQEEAGGSAAVAGDNSLPVANDAAVPAVLPAIAELAARIDELVALHWQASGVVPAEAADDATFLRRVTLDLAGRVPTRSEVQAFVAESSPDKRAAAIDRLRHEPEYALHLGNVLDDWIQGGRAGEGEFLAYLRESARDGKSWDQLFREIILGPWDSPERKRAERFLSQRLQNIDELTNDTSRVFFGVDISCAKCHDHPLVDDWKQDHYYGLASFLNRTYEFKGQEALVGERDAGDLEFVNLAGEKRTAGLMFLSGAKVDEPALADDPERKQLKEQAEKDGKYLPPPFSRREQLVQAALADQKFFSRSLVNRAWAYLLGRGLVHPVDQMHSDNPPAIAGALEMLADDLIAGGYDVDRLVAVIADSRAYQLAGTWSQAGDRPAAELFAAAALRPLSPKQYSLSAVLATGDEAFDSISEPAARADYYRQLESRAQPLAEWLDARSDSFQSSTAEALFMSNGAPVQNLVKPEGTNLVARLVETPSTAELVETAVWTVLSRAPDDEERARLAEWIDGGGQDRAQACRDLVWALVTSAEFRFNH